MSHWNAIKGGSDTITKLIWLNMYDPPSHSPQAHTIGRMLLLGGVVIHRLNHIFTAKLNLNETYPSLSHFRGAANKRLSFHETLLQIVRSIKYQNVQPFASLSLSSCNEGALTRRGDTRTKLVEWGSVPTGATPYKCVKKWYNKDPTSLTGVTVTVHNRMRKCVGSPIYRVNPSSKDREGAGSRSNCVECSRLTNVFCIGCRKWLCSPQFPVNRGSKNKDDPKYIKLLFEGSDYVEKEEICGYYSCWHKSHRAALEAEGALARGWCFDDTVSVLTP